MPSGTCIRYLQYDYTTRQDYRTGTWYALNAISNSESVVSVEDIDIR